MKFEEKPDYNYLRGLLRDGIKKNNLEIDYRYDWTTEVIKPADQSMTPRDIKAQ
jgi:casein kinase 1